VKANEDRGEFEIVFEGATYVMRPSWEAIHAFEAATGRSVVQLAGEANDSALQLKAMASIITECVKAWGREVDNVSARGFNVDRVMQLIVEEGALLVVKRLALMLFMAATGGVTSSGEAKPLTTTATSEADGNLPE
jgi:hypothetical protein